MYNQGKSERQQNMYVICMSKFEWGKYECIPSFIHILGCREHREGPWSYDAYILSEEREISTSKIQIKII